MTIALALPPPPVDSYPYDLGPHTLQVATTSPDCQTWFNRGLNWAYGFHHEESARCFRYAVACDPRCAMAYWGIAYALGPNYNKEWELFDADDLARSLRECRRACAEAQRLAERGGVEAALAQALAARFPDEAERVPEDEAVPSGAAKHDFKAWNKAYAAAMGGVYAQFGASLDVAALYADALMGLAPWMLWDLQTGAPREDSQTLVIQAVLDKALAQPGATTHPAILHFYIHLMELSPTPEKAVVPGDHLRGLVPDSGHLNHMPGHIDLLVGDYRRCIDTNLDAIRGDEKYMDLGSAVDFYTFYRLHDYTFIIYPAMFNGQYSVAMDAVERMERSLTDRLYRIPSPPMVDWLEGFKSYRTHVLVRFGKWKEILGMSFPEDRAFYCVTTTVLHYARAVAYSVLGEIDNAVAERELFRAARDSIAPTRFEYPNSWADILAVADAMITGELEYRRGNYDLAFEALRLAIHRSDNLVYAEPWGWMQPPRHAYAALLLEQGHVAEAADVYAEDLGFVDSLPRACRHPNNVWALHGYHECLVRLGRTAEARHIKPQLTLALAVAEIKVEASCFCRTVTGTGESDPVAGAVAAGGKTDPQVDSTQSTGSCCAQNSGLKAA